MPGNEAAMILGREDMTDWNGPEMWLQMKGRTAVAPVVYDHEHYPYLVFRGTRKGRGADPDAVKFQGSFDTEPDTNLYMLRAELYMKTWILYDRKPCAEIRRDAFREAAG